jgi:glutamyl-tRNA reductase
MDHQFSRKFVRNDLHASPAIHCISLSHHMAPAELREALSFAPGEIERALRSARLDAGIERIVIVSTCHRTELYADISGGPSPVATIRDETAPASRLIDWLARNRGVDRSLLDTTCSVFDGSSALTHLFRLTCGIESVIPGEPQIVSQVASALSRSVSAHAASPALKNIFKAAVRAGEHAQATVWGRLRRADLGTAAAAAALRFLESNGTTFAQASVAVFGAGELGELALSAVVEAGARNVTLVNRSTDRAVIVAERHSAQVRGLDEIASVLAAADVSIFALAESKSAISIDMVREAMRVRGGRPLALIDVGLPRNVDPDSRILADVCLLGIDELGDAVGEIFSGRAAVIPAVEEIIRGRTAHLLHDRSLSSCEPIGAIA